MIDTAAITGESVPREAAVGDEVISGCINLNGRLKIKVTRDFGQSTVAKILDLVENASSQKASVENFITRFARYYTPAVVFLALAIAVLPPLLVDGAAFSDWLYRALTFLVISCPCALVISVPLGFSAVSAPLRATEFWLRGAIILRLWRQPKLRFLTRPAP